MKFAFALALSLSGSPRDDWFARDKAKHFLAAAVMQTASYHLLRQRTQRSEVALWGATAVTSAASLGKEWYDRRQGRRFSGRDLAWDAGGATVASVAILRLRRR